ncbi:5'-AMP-activated protein kinase subunit beta-2-like isoform X1 [Mizuhopecten yessoensis]|uniref:5'-AMP-activated protein kinase subunit beta-2-like isoform X1 n=1 Tax=Mizuhopecten yessoensis TaxID=6573 RepID=UPI000B458824|nr:5'-AMP-activated protein kinase subunit beta-2-like isoform X1 [Mizuhopecten yessoensis]
MGNTTPKGRHASGDDMGPSLTAGRYMNDSGSFDPPDVLPPNFRRARAATTQSQGDPENLKEKLLPTVFKWEGGGKEVYISGTFNQWRQKIPLAKSHGNFITILDLPEGEHQYKFHVDGQWIHGGEEPTIENTVGTLNNIVNVKKSDFEVFEALALDSKNTNSAKRLDINGPQSEYGQEVPPRRPGEKHSGPPILPPHLLQVILNKDTPAHCEPSLLPEPNHVMLNHLYALSIKDGVMVLSGTHRFRKKYVTTLLYKPI